MISWKEFVKTSHKEHEGTKNTKKREEGKNP